MCRLYDVAQNLKALFLVHKLPNICPSTKRPNEHNSVNIPATHCSSLFKTKFYVVAEAITSHLGAEYVSICSSFLITYSFFSVYFRSNYIVIATMTSCTKWNRCIMLCNSIRHNICNSGAVFVAVILEVFLLLHLLTWHIWSFHSAHTYPYNFLYQIHMFSYLYVWQLHATQNT